MKQFLLFILFALLLTVLVMIPFAGGFSALASWLSSANPLLVVSLWAAGFALAAFFFGIFTGDNSWVDRLWSTLPVVFVWFYVWRGGFTPALLVAALLVSIWGTRLTWNFALKGGYSGTEDYRWPILRGRIRNPLLWQLFSLLFISCFQIGLFILFTMPVNAIAAGSAGGISLPFIAAALLAAGFIVIETVADNQQMAFQKAKRAAAASGSAAPVSPDQAAAAGSPYKEDIPRGFISSGLFGLCRHPNYFGELGFWWALWLMAFALTGNPLESGVYGPAALTALFTGSTIFTESLSMAKYPAYREYRKSHSPVIPWFPKKK